MADTKSDSKADKATQEGVSPIADERVDFVVVDEQGRTHEDGTRRTSPSPVYGDGSNAPSVQEQRAAESDRLAEAADVTGPAPETSAEGFSNVKGDEDSFTA